MVRIPGTEGEWEEHSHTSGRIFLSNPATNETRWLWQKWDMKGRLFVRNIANPAQQKWVDQMDLSMRLKSGTASQEEVARYTAHASQPPPPPPPPLPQQPPPQHWQHQHPSRDPHFPPPPPHFRHNHFDHQNAFGHPPAQPYHPHHDINPQSFRNGPDHFFPHRAPDNPNFRHQGPPRGLPGFENTHHPENNISHPPLHHPPPHLPAHPMHRPPVPFRPIPLPPSSTSGSFDNSNHHPSDAIDHQKHNHHPHNSIHNSEIRNDIQLKNKKRAHNSEAKAHGRYWSNEHKQGKKRSRTGSKSDPSKASRFAPLPEPIRPRSPRPPPTSPDSNELSGDLYGSFQPSSPAARRILASSVGQDALKVGLLHDRDFKSTISKNPLSPSSVLATNGAEEEYTFEAVVGTCEKIEKDYLRLTSAPKPEAVRPPHVLIKSLLHIKNSWREGAAEYDWTCRQLKSIRQDYKVQHIKDAHVADVYETHARIALENNDLGEFNTCVAQVQELYRLLDCSQRVQDEFACYRILYNVLVKSSQWEQGQILRRLSRAERNRKATRFALKIRHAIATGNYRNYFMLCLNPPPKTMVSYLLIHLHDRVRFRAASIMTSAYGPGHPGVIPMRFVMNQMGWDEADQPSQSLKHVKPESVVQSDDTKVIEGIRALSIHKQPAWVFEALAFFIGTNMSCVSNSETTGPFVDRVQIDFKATKAQGLSERKATTKLITHAGSEDVKLMK